jgi:hypothetical protein
MKLFNGKLYNIQRPNEILLNEINHNKIKKDEIAKSVINKLQRLNRKRLSDIKEEIEEKEEKEESYFNFLTEETILNQNILRNQVLEDEENELSSEPKLCKGSLIYENRCVQKQVDAIDKSLEEGSVLPEYFGKIKNEFLNKPLQEIGKK